MVINGQNLQASFYVRRDADPGFQKIDTTLGAFFSADFSVHAAAVKLQIPQFAFYRDDNETPTVHVPLCHGPDYAGHSVQIVVSELDSWAGYCEEKAIKAKSRSYHIKDYLLDKLGGEYTRRQAHALRVWQQLRQNPFILFAYLSPSGLGVRFAIYCRQRIVNTKEYRGYYIHYTRQLLQAYDPDGLMEIDLSLADHHCYWLFPTTNQVFVNPACHAVKRCVYL